MNLLLIALTFAASGSAAEPRRYDVPGSFPILKQIGETCWASTVTMMYNWKHGKSLSVEQTLALAGARFVRLYTGHAQLPGNMKPELLRALGIEAEAPQDYADEGWYELLQSYGLLWVTTATVFADEPFSTHARLVRGVKSTKEAGHLIFRIVDPETGKEYEEDSREFFELFDGLAFTQNRLTPREDLLPQVFHFPKMKR